MELKHGTRNSRKINEGVLIGCNESVMCSTCVASGSLLPRFGLVNVFGYGFGVRGESLSKCPES